MTELLITLLVASFVAIALYFLFTSNSRVFFLQERIAQSQASTRFVLETISADLRRAGYLATPNSTSDKNLCAGSPVGGASSPIRGISIADGVDQSVVNMNTVNTNIKPDRVTIAANFRSSEKYRAKVNGTTVTLCGTDDTHPLCVGSPTTSTAFNNLFAPNMFLRVEDTIGKYQFAVITVVAWNAGTKASPPTITISAAPSTSCGFHGGDMAEDAFVNPVEYIRYRIETPTNLGCATDPKNRILIRERLDSAGNPYSPSNYWMIADNMVDLQVWADLDTGAGGGDSVIPANPNPYNHRGNEDNNPIAGADETAKVNLNPHLARTVHVAIAIRAPSEVPNYAFTARPVNNLNAIGEYYGPITSMALSDAGAAPVQTLTLEAVLENFFYGWYY
ncbi:MAG: hypothetical protein HYY84_06695 [Deltaproteobacteria bacterium]|nr:hypothetical protein [Deltaproteobacteria bacterium]